MSLLRYGDTEDTEILRFTDSEFRKNGDSEETHDTNEASSFLHRNITSIVDAINAALEAQGDDAYFNFARALKAFEIATRQSLDENDLLSAFNTWFLSVKGKIFLEPDVTQDEHFDLFIDSFKKVRTPLGSNVLEECVRRMLFSQPPKEVDHYSSPATRKLVHLCYELQKLSYPDPFFISCREAGKIIGRDHWHTSKLINGMVRRNILKAEPRNRRKRKDATRYAYLNFK